jgi:pimeloyl-ACP methyl ester carboxylesterase
MNAVTEGTLSTGVPYLRLGSGPPLFVAAGLTAKHANPTGTWRRSSVAWARPFAEHFTVYLVNRRPGLEPGTTMSQIADDYARAIEDDIGEPVLLHGTSTGGSVAVQLAVDRPELVRRLVLAASACRLSPEARDVMARVARMTREGDRRGAMAAMVGTSTKPALGILTRRVGWVMGQLSPAEAPDMLAVIAAEDEFDVEDRLDRVTAPTLVLGGDADGFYSRDLFERTAAGVRDGRAVVFRNKTHVYVAGAKVPAAIGLGFLLAD